MQPSQVEKTIDQLDFTIHSLIRIRNQMADKTGQSNLHLILDKKEINELEPKPVSPKRENVMLWKQNSYEAVPHTLNKKEARKFIENFCNQSETFLPTHDRGPMYQCVRYIEASMTKAARNAILSKLYESLPKNHSSPMPSPGLSR
jgi:hypothetical protein